MSGKTLRGKELEYSQQFAKILRDAEVSEDIIEGLVNQKVTIKNMRDLNSEILKSEFGISVWGDRNDVLNAIKNYIENEGNTENETVLNVNTAPVVVQPVKQSTPVKRNMPPPPKQNVEVPFQSPPPIKQIPQKEIPIPVKNMPPPKQVQIQDPPPVKNLPIPMKQPVKQLPQPRPPTKMIRATESQEQEEYPSSNSSSFMVPKQKVQSSYEAPTSPTPKPPPMKKSVSSYVPNQNPPSSYQQPQNNYQQQQPQYQQPQSTYAPPPQTTYVPPPTQNTYNPQYVQVHL
jgi:hypothetical protein